MNMPTIPDIKKAVAYGFNVSVEHIDSRTRKQPIALARQTVYYYTRKLLGLKYEEMENKFDRDHSNIVYGVKAIEDRLEVDIETQAMIHGLESEFPWLRGEEVEVKV
jgi:chromosomal replication initiator protein